MDSSPKISTDKLQFCSDFALLGMFNMYMGKGYNNDHIVDHFYPSESRELVDLMGYIINMVSRNVLMKEYPETNLYLHEHHKSYMIKNPDVAKYMHSDKFFVKKFPDGYPGTELNIDVWKASESEKLSYLWGCSKRDTFSTTDFELKFQFANSMEKVKMTDAILRNLINRYHADGLIFKTYRPTIPTLTEVGYLAKKFISGHLFTGSQFISNILGHFKDFDKIVEDFKKKIF